MTDEEFVERVALFQKAIQDLETSFGFHPIVKVGALIKELTEEVLRINKHAPQEYAEGLALSLDTLAMALRRRTTIVRSQVASVSATEGKNGPSN